MLQMHYPVGSQHLRQIACDRVGRRAGQHQGVLVIPVARVSRFDDVESPFDQVIAEHVGLAGASAAVEHLDLTGVGFECRSLGFVLAAGESQHDGR